MGGAQGSINFCMDLQPAVLSCRCRTSRPADESSECRAADSWTLQRSGWTLAPPPAPQTRIRRTCPSADGDGSFWARRGRADLSTAMCGWNSCFGRSNGNRRSPFAVLNESCVVVVWETFLLRRTCLFIYSKKILSQALHGALPVCGSSILRRRTDYHWLISLNVLFSEREKFLRFNFPWLRFAQ